MIVPTGWEVLALVVTLIVAVFAVTATIWNLSRPRD